MKIVLIGFMATGKSVVAPVVASKLGLDVIEMDDLIVRKSDFESIAEIFEAGGEVAFRQLEKSVSNDLRRRDHAVISAGGGVVTDRTVMANLSDQAIVVGLFAPFTTLVKRISPDIPRPLFKDAHAAERLYELRKPLYNEYAAIRIETGTKSVNEIADEIVRQVRTYEHHR